MAAQFHLLLADYSGKYTSWPAVYNDRAPIAREGEFRLNRKFLRSSEHVVLTFAGTLWRYRRLERVSEACLMRVNPARRSGHIEKHSRSAGAV